MTICNRQAAALPLTTALTLHAEVRGPGNWREPETRTLVRLAAQQPVPVQEGWTLGRRQAVLAYVRNEPDSRGIAAGYYSLEDHPTLGSLSLRPGTSLRADGTTRPLGAAEVAEDDYRVLLALHQLYLCPA